MVILAWSIAGVCFLVAVYLASTSWHNQKVDERTIAARTTERDDARAQRERLNTENENLRTAYALLLAAHEKLEGQVKELQGLLASAEQLNRKLQEKLDDAYDVITELSAAKPEPVAPELPSASVGYPPVPRKKGKTP